MTGRNGQRQYMSMVQRNPASIVLQLRNPRHEFRVHQSTEGHGIVSLAVYDLTDDAVCDSSVDMESMACDCQVSKVMAVKRQPCEVEHEQTRDVMTKGGIVRSAG